MKPRVFHLITSLNFGGTENFLKQIVLGLKDRYDFSVGYIKQEGITAAELRRAGISVTKLTNPWTLCRRLRTWKPALLHTHMYRANMVGRLAGKLARVPAIVSSQRSSDDWKKIYHIWLDRFTALWTAKIVANCKATRELLVRREHIDPSKIEVIYNGIEPDFLKSSQDRPAGRALFSFAPQDIVVGFAGRFHKEKGSHWLPEIILRATGQNPRIRFLLAGDGPEKQALVAVSEKLKGRVILAGMRSDMTQVLSAMDIFLLPSWEESFSQSALEALAAGLPVVASDVGGLSELITQDVGVLVPRGDTQGYTQALQQLAENPQLRGPMQKAAAAKASEFSLSKMLQKVDALYTSRPVLDGCINF